jgi:hypothetical protein
MPQKTKIIVTIIHWYKLSYKLINKCYTNNDRQSMQE